MEDILYKINNKINNITETYYLDKIIKKCQDRKREIAEDNWEKAYKTRCKEHYVPLRSVFADFWIMNDANVARELEDYYINSPHGLSYLLHKAESLELKVPYNVGKMACTACVCGGCPYQEECNGYTCKECKQHSYTGYQWECEE